MRSFTRVRRTHLVRPFTLILVLALAAMSISACSEVEPEAAKRYEPAKLEPIKGSEYQRVIFTAEGARRVGLKTERVRSSNGQTSVPFASLLYDSSGAEFVYTSPEALVFVRVPIKVDRVVGNRVLVSEGPLVGTDVVTVGVAEVYGAEYGVSQ